MTKSRWIPAPIDVALIAVAVISSALTVLYPFGHDQGVHYYVGREWALRGAIPYRDTFDYKTPGIFALHAVLVRICGEQIWGIRAIELLCVVALGFICAHLIERRHPRPGFVGFVCFTTFVLYYGYFSFWDTAQCEIWAATFVLASLLAVRSRRALIAGVLVALALLMKPPALLLALPTFWYALHTRRDAWRFAIGLAAPLAITVAYFAYHRALEPMSDILFGADVQYVVGTRRVNDFGDMYMRLVDVMTWFNPFAPLLAGLFVFSAFKALARGTRVVFPRVLVVLAVLALAAIAVQMKFFRYHYAMLVGPLVLSVAYLQTRTLARHPVVASFVVAVLYAFSGEASRNWLFDQRAAFALATHAIARDAFAHHFAIPSVSFNDGDSEDVGGWLRNHTSADELVLVRGFQPEVYAFAERRARGRFFWTTPITDPSRLYKRAEWTTEDTAALMSTLPHFIVTPSDVHSGPDAIERFATLGYERCHSAGRLVILARPKSSPCEL